MANPNFPPLWDAKYPRPADSYRGARRNAARGTVWQGEGRMHAREARYHRPIPDVAGPGLLIWPSFFRRGFR